MILDWPEMTWGATATLMSAAVLVGMAKTGVHGAGMMAVPMVAAVFGGQTSSGLMLPLLVLADVMGVWYYHRHASWMHLRKLFPWAAAGVVAGTLAGYIIPDLVFRWMMGMIIFISLAVMVWMEIKPREIPTSRWFVISTGVLGGFTSMVGNLANTVMAVYLMSVRLPKQVFIGTTAWFFLVINWFKVPFHVWVWKTISVETTLLALMLLPLIVIGGGAGIWIVSRFSDQAYRWLIVVSTAVSALFMLLF